MSNQRVLFAVAVVALVAAALHLGGCQGGSTPPSAKVEQAGAGGGEGVKMLNGAGATFPYPIYSQWAYAYNKESGLQLNYQSIGSGGGISQIKAKTVDFGASDAPLTVAELDEAGLMQFPLVMGGVVPVVNVKGAYSGPI